MMESPRNTTTEPACGFCGQQESPPLASAFDVSPGPTFGSPICCAADIDIVTHSQEQANAIQTNLLLNWLASDSPERPRTQKGREIRSQNRIHGSSNMEFDRGNIKLDTSLGQAFKEQNNRQGNGVIKPQKRDGQNRSAVGIRAREPLMKKLSVTRPHNISVPRY